MISNESDIIDHIPISPIKQDDMPNDDLEIYILMRMLNRIKLDSAGMKDDEVFNSFFENLGSRLAELNVAFKAVKPSIQQTDLDLLILRIKKTIILLINLLKFDSNSLDASSSKALDYSYLLMDLTNKHLIKHGKASLKVIQNLFSITWELIQTHIDFELVDTHEHLFLRKNRKEFTTKLLLENQTVIINTVEKMDGFFNDLFILKKLQEQATESDLITHAGIIKIAKQFNQYENKLSVFFTT